MNGYQILYDPFSEAVGMAAGSTLAVTYDEFVRSWEYRDSLNRMFFIYCIGDCEPPMPGGFIREIGYPEPAGVYSLEQYKTEALAKTAAQNAATGEGVAMILWKLTIPYNNFQSQTSINGPAYQGNQGWYVVSEADADPWRPEWSTYVDRFEP